MNLQKILSLRSVTFFYLILKWDQQCNSYTSCSLAGVFDACSFHKKWVVFSGIARVLEFGGGALQLEKTKQKTLPMSSWHIDFFQSFYLL